MLLVNIRDLERRPMSNRALWSVKKRHEWLAKPMRPRRIKRAARLRCGLQDAMDRKVNPTAEGQG